MPDATFGAIPGDWDWSDRPLFIVGSGPSLIGKDLSRLHQLGRVLAVKEPAFDLPHVDAMVCSDWRWPQRRVEAIAALTCPVFLAVDDPRAFYTPPNATLLRREHGDDMGGPAWSHQRDALAFGATSGYSALNLGVLAGATKILLLGFDYGHERGGPHHANDRQVWYAASNHRLWPEWAARFDYAKQVVDRLGVKVVNLSPDSAITAFPREPFHAISDLPGI